MMSQPGRRPFHPSCPKSRLRCKNSIKVKDGHGPRITLPTNPHKRLQRRTPRPMHRVNPKASNKAHMHNPTNMLSPQTRQARPATGNHSQFGRVHLCRLPRVPGCCVPRRLNLRNPRARSNPHIMIPTREGTISTMTTTKFSSTTTRHPLLLLLLRQLPRQALRHRRTLIAWPLLRVLHQRRVPRHHTPPPCRPHAIRGCLLLPPALSPRPLRVQEARLPARLEASISVRVHLSMSQTVTHRTSTGSQASLVCCRNDRYRSSGQSLHPPLAPVQASPRRGWLLQIPRVRRTAQRTEKSPSSSRIRSRIRGEQVLFVGML